MSEREGKGFPRSVLLVAAVTTCLVAPASAPAATITPTITADEYSNPTPDTGCSLRESVQSLAQGSNFGGCAASGSYGATDTIQLPAGSYALTIAPAGTDDNATGDLSFTFKTVSVQAQPGAKVTIDGNNTDRIFFFSGDLTLRDVTLSGGNASTPESDTGKSGGAIFSTGGSSLTISDSTLTDNSSDGFGGAIAANGPVTLTNTTVSGNTATDIAGGGIAVDGNTGALTLESSTVTDNHSLVNDMAESTVAGGILISDGNGATATAHNSIIAANTDASDTYDHPNCQGTISSTGGNVFGDTTGCTFNSVASDATNVDPLIAGLADNGGTTFTHALLTGSPAIDRGVGVSPATDQRGFARPFPAGGACDSGAYEFEAVLDPSTAVGCPVPPPAPGGGAAQPGTTLAPNPVCAPLRKKLRGAKRAHKTAKVRKLKKKLRKLGC